MAQEEKEKRHASHFEYSIDDYEVGPAEIERRLAPHYDRYDWPRMSGNPNETTEEPGA